MAVKLGARRLWLCVIHDKQKLTGAETTTLQLVAAPTRKEPAVKFGSSLNNSYSLPICFSSSWLKALHGSQLHLFLLGFSHVHLFWSWACLVITAISYVSVFSSGLVP